MTQKRSSHTIPCLSDVLLFLSRFCVHCSEQDEAMLCREGPFYDYLNRLSVSISLYPPQSLAARSTSHASLRRRLLPAIGGSSAIAIAVTPSAAAVAQAYVTMPGCLAAMRGCEETDHL